MPSQGERTQRSAMHVKRQQHRQRALELLDEELEDLTAAELVALSQELRRMARQQREPNPLGFLQGSSTNTWLLLALAVLLLPQMRQLLKPLIAAAAQGANELSNNASGLFQGAQDWLEDIVAEAQFQKLQKSMDPGFNGTQAAGSGGGSATP